MSADRSGVRLRHGGVRIRTGSSGPARQVGFWVVLFVTLGAALRAAQFLANRSLWIDEAALALNLVHRSFGELARRLDYGQMAPVGFLWLEKAVTFVLGTGEPALRLLPFAASLSALLLFVPLSRALLAATGTVVAVGLFAVNHRLVYYGSEVKQYSTDVAVSVGLLWVGTLLLRRPVKPRELAGLAAAGTLAGWLSTPACFLLAGIGASMTVLAWRRRDRRSMMRASLLSAWWTITVVPILLLERRNLSAEDSRIIFRYWSDGFPPLPLDFPGVLGWARAAVARALAYLFEPTELGERARQIFTLLIVGVLVLGFAAMARRRAEAFVLIAVPLALTLAGAVVRVYPFSRRLTLCLVPMLLLCAGEGVDAVRTGLGRWGPVVAGALGAGFLAVTAARTFAVLPERPEDLRPVLAELARRSRPGDAIYVHNGAVRAFEYYAPRLGLSARDVILGCCHKNQWPLELASIRRLGARGRVWFVFSHWHKGEPEFFATALGRFGRRLGTFRAEGSAAHLYELGAIDDAAFAEALAQAPVDRRSTETDWECVAGILRVEPCGPP